MIIAIIIFVAIPICMAFLAKITYNLFFPLTKINGKAKIFDDESPNMPYDVKTIDQIRNHQKIGEKIVFTHHLAPLANEFRKTIVKTFVKTLMFEFILLFIVSMGAASQTPTAKVDIFSNLNILATQWKVYYLVPLGMIALVIEFMFYYNFLNEQISKYNI